jgi:hypothetical protein
VRLFVLLAWHPALGLPANPVGVLAVEETAGGRCMHRVSWIPSSIRTDCGWRSRLATSPTMATVTSWLDQAGAAQLAEIPVPAQAASLADAVEITIDSLLAEVTPRLPPPESS